MKTYVTFCHPQPFQSLIEGDNILSVKGAGWFVSILQRIPSLQIDSHLCQEDWGVVIFVRQEGKRYWIGLSDSGLHGSQTWLAHLHYGSGSFIQKLTGSKGLGSLAQKIHQVLKNSPEVASVTWYSEQEFRTGSPGSENPS